MTAFLIIVLPLSWPTQHYYSWFGACDENDIPQIGIDVYDFEEQEGLYTGYASSPYWPARGYGR